jgi:hypothetical protein
MKKITPKEGAAEIYLDKKPLWIGKDFVINIVARIPFCLLPAI